MHLVLTCLVFIDLCWCSCILSGKIFTSWKVPSFRVQSQQTELNYIYSSGFVSILYNVQFFFSFFLVVFLQFGKWLGWCDLLLPIPVFEFFLSFFLRFCFGVFSDALQKLIGGNGWRKGNLNKSFSGMTIPSQHLMHN